MKTTSNAVEILDRMARKATEIQAMQEEERKKLRVARMVYEARIAAGLTQAELAARVGTRLWVIARLEDADYDGHTLEMLARIANSLDHRVEIRLVPRRAEMAVTA